MTLPERNDWPTGEEDLSELCLLCRAELVEDGEEGICTVCLEPLAVESDFQDKLREVIGSQRILLRQVSDDTERAHRLLDSCDLGRKEPRE